MKSRILIASVLALSLGACSDLGLPEQGFLTHAFDSDEDAPATAPNGCTPTACPQAPGFCTARGYAPGTVGYQRCIVSVEDNLRKASR